MFHPVLICLTVSFNNLQGLEILKASLQSKTVLTDVFLSKKDQLLVW